MLRAHPHVGYVTLFGGIALAMAVGQLAAVVINR